MIQNCQSECIPLIIRLHSLLPFWAYHGLWESLISAYNKTFEIKYNYWPRYLDHPMLSVVIVSTASCRLVTCMGYNCRTSWLHSPPELVYLHGLCGSSNGLRCHVLFVLVTCWRRRFLKPGGEVFLWCSRSGRSGFVKSGLGMTSEVSGDGMMWILKRWIDFCNDNSSSDW